MEEWLITQGIYLLRILTAAFCGAIIGWERENKSKNAGIRTHLIVAIASALMMIVSKYGFYDVLGTNGMELDPSRIAAGIVTAIGFLGAGIIFVHKQTVSGLTTSAGIWATVGIGMAIGSGLYMLGVVTAILITILQSMFQKHKSMLKMPMSEKIVLIIDPEKNDMSEKLAKFKENRIEVINTTMNKKHDGMIEIKLYVRFPENYALGEALQMLIADSTIQSLDT